MNIAHLHSYSKATKDLGPWTETCWEVIPQEPRGSFQLLGRIFHSGSWAGRSPHSSLWDGVKHRCEDRDVSGPCLFVDFPGGLLGMPAPHLPLRGQGLHLSGEQGGPGSPGHPRQRHRTVSGVREELWAAALLLAPKQTAVWKPRVGLVGSKLTPAVWKAQPFLRRSFNFILKLLSLTLTLLILRSPLRKDMVCYNAKCRLNFKQASLVLWQ